ncbi:MAG TPA: FAD-binding oxidoreductase [Nitriliruptorales bacterium]
MEAALLADLHAGFSQVESDAERTRLYAHDWWPRPLMRLRSGEALTPPEAVVAPADRDELMRLVGWCHTRALAIVPYGAGTGVCGGALPVTGAITLDLKRLNRIGTLDEVSGTVEVEPGVIAQALEDHLQHRGWTLGHFPSSVNCSTVGGFLAIRSAGQASSFYGKFEDAVVGLDAVLADGSLFRARPVPQSAAGPDLKRLFLGGEGTTGIIAGATLRVWPEPQVAIDRGLLFPDIESGLAACRTLLWTGLRPHVWRLYDETDTAMVFGGQGLDVPEGCLCIVGAEGDPEVAGFVAGTARRIMVEGGARDLGEEPGRHWRAHRHGMSYRFAELMKPGGMLGDALALDTMEVASTWSRIVPAYHAIKQAISPHLDLVMAHFSHVYPEGASIYFTFGKAGAGNEELALASYDAAWEAGQRAALSAGASITHHHGVGLLRAPYLEDELGAVGLDVLRRVKGALDPHGLLNPTKLGLDLRASP